MCERQPQEKEKLREKEHIREEKGALEIGKSICRWRQEKHAIKGNHVRKARERMQENKRGKCVREREGKGVRDKGEARTRKAKHKHR